MGGHGGGECGYGVRGGGGAWGGECGYGVRGGPIVEKSNRANFPKGKENEAIYFYSIYLLSVGFPSLFPFKSPEIFSQLKPFKGTAEYFPE